MSDIPCTRMAAESLLYLCPLSMKPPSTSHLGLSTRVLPISHQIRRLTIIPRGREAHLRAKPIWILSRPPPKQTATPVPSNPDPHQGPHKPIIVPDIIGDEQWQFVDSHERPHAEARVELVEVWIGHEERHECFADDAQFSGGRNDFDVAGRGLAEVSLERKNPVRLRGIHRNRHPVFWTQLVPQISMDNDTLPGAEDHGEIVPHPRARLRGSVLVGDVQVSALRTAPVQHVPRRWRGGVVGTRVDGFAGLVDVVQRFFVLVVKAVALSGNGWALPQRRNVEIW